MNKPQTPTGRGLAAAYPASPSIVEDVVAIEREAAVDVLVRQAKAARLLDTWAQAVRGSWGSDFDGRTARDQLGELSKYLRGEREQITPFDIGVCSEGDVDAHWWGDDYGHTCQVPSDND